MNLSRANFFWMVAGGLAGAVLMVVGWASTYGEMKSKVASVDVRVTKLEEMMGKVARPKVLKGDLCLKLLDQFNAAAASATQLKDIEAQLTKLNCYEGVSENAATLIEDANSDKANEGGNR